eukprot:2115701-Amphidinium_carterae.1
MAFFWRGRCRTHHDYSMRKIITHSEGNMPLPLLSGREVGKSECQGISSRTQRLGSGGQASKKWCKSSASI